MPCWARCLLGFWWIWGIGAIVAFLIGLTSFSLVVAALIGLGWLGFTLIAGLIVCVQRCGGFV
jgi:hypothetical protein